MGEEKDMSYLTRGEGSQHHRQTANTIRIWCINSDSSPNVTLSCMLRHPSLLEFVWLLLETIKTKRVSGDLY